MKILIQKAKNGEETALAANIFLHSNYAPSKEAERFIENLSIPYNPKIIIITEPALSYTAKLLKKKYPDAKTGAIRYTSDFNNYNSNFDFVLNFYEHKEFSNYLSSIFNEEELLSIYFLSWQPSSKVFYEEDKSCWAYIKQSLENAKTLLVTRQYFEKKWLLNTFSFLRYLKKPVFFNSSVEKIDKPVLIVASGPSLKSALNILRNHSNKFFIICLSSAISVCLENNITPDLCMSTDGGYWAGQHLKALENNDIVLAFPPEAYCKRSLLEKLRILPLIYDDGISKKLLDKCSLNFIKVQRNGTVSGTALDFAYEYFSNDIYFCGLDLSSNKGFQHTQPNELEKNNQLKDNRITTKEKRCAAGSFSNASLEIYLNWFKNKTFNDTKRKIYRIINEEDKHNQLGQIQDINVLQFENKIQNIKLETSTSPSNKYFISQNFNIDLKATAEIFENTSEVEKIKRQLFPLDYVSLSHNTSNTEMKEKIEERFKELYTKIRKLVYE